MTSAVGLELLRIDGVKRTPYRDDRRIVENDRRSESLDAEGDVGSRAEESCGRSWARDLHRLFVREAIGMRTPAICML